MESDFKNPYRECELKMILIMQTLPNMKNIQNRIFL